MSLDRRRMYRMPWSQTDNPGAWVEVTDECDLACPGCFRHRIEGHRKPDDVKEEVTRHRRERRVSRIGIAGGEPLIYPHIVEVVDFISRSGLKPVLFTNGEKLTWDLARDLKRAGLDMLYFHVDANQQRPGWQDRTELEMNELRQRFADLVHRLGRLHCGYVVTVRRSSLKQVPDIVAWTRANIDRVHHLFLIPFRAMPISERVAFYANGRELDPRTIPNSTDRLSEIDISSDEMYHEVEARFPDAYPCAYLNGTSRPETHKFLMLMLVGTRRAVCGGLGARTMELVQVFHHLLRGSYCAHVVPAGHRTFLLAPFDPEVRRTLRSYLRHCLRSPLFLLDRVHVQLINFQQPLEVIEGQTNTCDGCVNLMYYKGELINSCRLDEYRMLGGRLIPSLRA